MLTASQPTFGNLDGRPSQAAICELEGPDSEVAACAAEPSTDRLCFYLVERGEFFAVQFILLGLTGIHSPVLLVEEYLFATTCSNSGELNTIDLNSLAQVTKSD